MIKSGQVPEDLQQLYEEGSKNSPLPRLFKSQIINKVFQQNTRGESVFAPGTTQCEVFKKNSEIRIKKSQVSLHHVAEKIQGNQQALNEQKNEVMSIRKMVTIMSGQ